MRKICNSQQKGGGFNPCALRQTQIHVKGQTEFLHGLWSLAILKILVENIKGNISVCEATALC